MSDSTGEAHRVPWRCEKCRKEFNESELWQGDCPSCGSEDVFQLRLLQCAECRYTGRDIEFDPDHNPNVDRYIGEDSGFGPSRNLKIDPRFLPATRCPQCRSEKEPVDAPDVTS